ncbi:hypothetical protein JWS14_39730 [Rhodococcus koreensis]|nr:hypothetical protein [Rhodococcus koreensis]QSE85550.1 hypothetical protein JWS14_39730 [Rhodococcus koreensis]
MSLPRGPGRRLETWTRMTHLLDEGRRAELWEFSAGLFKYFDCRCSTDDIMFRCATW